MSYSTILIQQGRVIDPANDRDEVADVFIQDGTVQQVGQLDPWQVGADQVIDARGQLVTPGFIDLHVHVREPGREDQENIRTISRAAAKGGYTTLVAMPNSDPPADDQTVIEFLLSRANRDAIVNILPCGCITRGLKGEHIADIWELKQSGAVVVSDDGFDVDNTEVYRKALQYCQTHSMPVLSHTEDHSRDRSGQMHEGLVSTRLGLAGIPAYVEDIATDKLLALVEEVGHPVHFTHVSTKGAVERIRAAQKRGLPVTADTTIHHLVLTDEAVDGYNTYAKIAPPLRSDEHRQTLIEGFQDGTLSALVTDHAPHLWVDKQKPFDEAPFGMVGLEVALPLLATHFVETGTLDWPQAIAKLTAEPARILGLSGGTLSVDARADVTIIDPEAKQTVDTTHFESKGMNAPYHGLILKGQVTHTLVSGEVVMKEGKLRKL